MKWENIYTKKYNYKENILYREIYDISSYRYFSLQFINFIEIN